MAISRPQDPSASTATSGLARSAALLSLGSMVSRGLGLVREIVVASLFGASGEVSAFRIAAQAPTLLYDFLIGGMLSAALVPVLSDYARRERSLLVRLAQTLISLLAVGLALLTVLLIVAAPWLTQVLAGGFRAEHPELLGLTTQLMRLAAPLVWLLGLAGVLTAVLFAQGRFGFPALATAIYNLGIVAVAPLLAPRIGVTALVVGLLAGGVAQVILLVWDVRRSGVTLRFRFDWRHPALRRILTLYGPIAAGMVVALLQVGLDRRLATTTGEQSVAWMATATTLQQLPLGLVSIAIALAALPQLSQQYAAQDTASFRQTLGRGLRLVSLLIAPAAVAFWLLGGPLTRMLFERGSFTPADSEAVVRALNIYALGMIFAAIDFPLNYAFYARNNTQLPALVGVLSTVAYLVVALTLLNSLGYLGLVWADTAKQASHALIMLLLLFAKIGRPGATTVRTVGSVVLAAVMMALVMAVIGKWLVPFLPVGRASDLVELLVVGGAGIVIYILILSWLGVGEAQLVWLRVRRLLLKR